jgi:hypothetical protein
VFISRTSQLVAVCLVVHMQVWDGPHAALTLPMNQTVPNVAASMVPASAPRLLQLPKHQAFMALENGNYPIAINTGTDRDLSKNWEIYEHGHGVRASAPASESASISASLPAHTTFFAFASACVRGMRVRVRLRIRTRVPMLFFSVWFLAANNLPLSHKLKLFNPTKTNRTTPQVSSAGVACPAARYNPADGYYYVFGGGNDITLARSKNLNEWEPRNMSMMTHCIAEEICLKYRPACPPTATNYQGCCIQTPDCSPASGEGQIAPGYFTEYWKNKSDCRNVGQPNQHCQCYTTPPSSPHIESHRRSLHCTALATNATTWVSFIPLVDFSLELPLPLCTKKVRNCGASAGCVGQMEC